MDAVSIIYKRQQEVLKEQLKIFHMDSDTE